ncbi:MAG: endonuclease MutS2 [Oligoflexia bacterium]|nr:MAG: endonuclease MutS2 [Oligoflexia bacterium]
MDLRHLDWIEILKHIQAAATSGAAKLSIQNLQPFQSQQEALEHQNDIFYALEILGQGNRPFMESLDLFEPWHSRVKRKALLKTLEIKDVRSFCLESLALEEALKMIPNPLSRKNLERLMKSEEPLSAIDQILTPGGEIRSDASETLYRLFREKENLSRQIQTTLDRLVKDHQMATYLQDKYVTTREGRWVLPVRSGHQHSVDGIIHGSSQTKQTVFMEPEAVIPVNNRLRQVEVEIEDEIERLLTQLSEYLSTLSLDFEKTRDVLLDMDVLFAKAQWAIQIEAKPFQFTENEIFLVDVKHPLLQMGQKKPVPNTVQMTEKKCILLLSGPNAGGKTVLLKSIGLAAQMSRYGLPLCAGEESRLPFFKAIHVGIGDSQNVGEELSTFAAHLKVLDEASKLQGLKNLILIDEICGSTDPEEGSALARAFIEEFAAHHCFAIVTSHLGPLKSGWKDEDRVLNGSLEYDAKSGRPTYQFLPGVPGDSLAIQTAKRVGVIKKIIDRSIELLSPVTRSRLAGLEQLEQLKSDIHTLQDHLKKELQKAKFEKEKFEALSQKLEKEKADILTRTAREAGRKIDELISQTKVDQTFKKHAALQEIKQNLPEIVKSKPGTGSLGPVETAEDFGKRFPAGTKVFVPSLGQDGIIQSQPNAKGEVLVLSGSIRLQLNWKELRPPVQAQNPTANLVRRASGVTVALQDTDRTIDLRGMTVEEAISQLEIDLDQASAHKEGRIKIIHGHGTEALKKAVRAYLSRSVYVKKWKSGSPEQGGDGMTWAELGED